MKIFLFRLSRLMSVVSILLCLTVGIVTFFGNQNYNVRDTVLITLLFSLTLIVPMVFNWLCFGRFSVWISKTVIEETKLD